MYVSEHGVVLKYDGWGNKTYLTVTWSKITE